MFAKLELTEDIKKFIKDTEYLNEDFNGIKELLFTSEMTRVEYSLVDIINIQFHFKEIKMSAYSKIKNNQELNIIEGMLIDRLLTKYNGLSLISVEKHLEWINENCEEVEPKMGLIGIIKQFSERIGNYVRK